VARASRRERGGGGLSEGKRGKARASGQQRSKENREGDRSRKKRRPLKTRGSGGACPSGVREAWGGGRLDVASLLKGPLTMGGGGGGGALDLSGTKGKRSS